MILAPNVEDDFILNEPFALASGERLPQIKQRYAIYGELNTEKSNAVLVFHALTGSARIAEWWTDLIGAGKALDTNRFAFVCVNALGSCYGSTSANEIKSVVTTRDIVRAQKKLFEHLGVEKFRACVGGSVGGMLAMQFAADFPDAVENCIPIGASPLSAMGLALNHLQRAALKYENGIVLARQIAMLSYKSKELFNQRFSRNPNRNGENPFANLEHRFDISGYLDYQGEKFTERFDAQTYRILSKAMDLFDLTDEEIKQIKAKVSLVGISTDWLFPAEDVRFLAARMKKFGVDAEYFEMISDDGHDAFLSDAAKMSEVFSSIFKDKL
jgi:homoserine O-acetyltransferase